MNGVAGEDSTRLENCLIEANQAYAGGGIYMLRASSRILNCTITENTATYGGGISCWHSAARIVNCIVWGNLCHYSDPAIEIGADIYPAVSHCDVDQAGYGKYGDGSADSFGNIRLDPLFTAGPLGNRYLSQTAAGQATDSPCVDSGTITELSSWIAAYMTTRTDGGPDSDDTDLGFHYTP
jgi:hypothetical protein